MFLIAWYKIKTYMYGNISRSINQSRFTYISSFLRHIFLPCSSFEIEMCLHLWYLTISAGKLWWCSCYYQHLHKIGNLKNKLSTWKRIFKGHLRKDYEYWFCFIICKNQKCFNIKDYRMVYITVLYCILKNLLRG